jgi:hypothetical protein
MFQAKTRIGGLLGDEVLGALDYLRFPERRVSPEEAFNGQRNRQKLFQELIERFAPEAIIETGTYRGTTTQFMAAKELPVFSIEDNPRNYGFSRVRLWRQRNVSLLNGDSRRMLRALFEGPLRRFEGKTLFFYLDAHWNEDLPLAGELEIVFGNCPAAIVMIDDFQVPFDAGYGYDDYGPGKSLVPDYVEPICAAHQLNAFYPSTPSSRETGACRGCAVIAKRQIHGDGLRVIPLLRSVT